MARLILLIVFGIVVLTGCPRAQPPGTPTARFTIDPPSVGAGDKHMTVVTLDGTSSSDPEMQPLTFDWNVSSCRPEDGTTDSDSIFKCSFVGAHDYLVRLTVTDPDMNSDTANGVVICNGC